MTGREIPEKLKWTLRKDFNYCCPICGCPIIEYHHIIPWALEKKHEENNIIPLCPTHHAEATKGIISAKSLSTLKGLGKKSPGLKHSVTVNSKDFKIQLGPWTFEKPREMISADDVALLSVDRTDESNLLLSALFCDQLGNTLVSIEKNELVINDPAQFSDIRFQANRLTIKLRTQILFLLEFTTEYIWIKRARFYYNSCSFIFDENSFDMCNGRTHFKDKNVQITQGAGYGIMYYSYR